MNAVATPSPIAAVSRGLLMDGFLRNLRDSGLLPEHHVDQMAQHFGTRTLDELTQLLLEENCLTLYQINRVVAGKTADLVMGQYRITDVLGSGAFGVVYKAVHAMMNRTVALKVISPEFVRDPDIRQLFVREAQATNRLVHPNIAILYDADSHKEQMYLAMEFVDGTDLDTLVNRNGKVPLSSAYSMLWQIVQALAHAHSFGIVHRDIKPANLMVARDTARESAGKPALMGSAKGTIVKIIDFGFARLFPRGSPKAQSINARGSLVGTPEFMAPEQARDVHAADARSDIYSLGCTFYFVMSGKLPFAGETPVDTLMAHTETTPRPLSEVCPDIPAPISAVIQRMMARDPNARYQTSEELATAMTFAIGHLMDDRGTTASVTTASRPQALPHEGPDSIGIQEVRDLARVEADACMLSDADSRELPLLWSEWVNSVREILANPTKADDEQYHCQRSTLLQRIAIGDAREHSSRLQSLIEPLVSVEAILRLDKATRRQFVAACQDLTRTLSPPPPRPSRVLEVVAVMLIVAGLATSAFGAPIMSRVLAALNTFIASVNK
jgi:serine/threonine-protein kinase